jgi:3-hydroxyacyl-CoA dehydrogenase / enoyl-CoA hydratase / 3-hydroxybutyryl-CoA epimerase
MYIYKAGVVGAGTMGAEIAQVITYAGLPVYLKDVSDELVQKGLARVRSIYQRRVDKGKMTAHEMESKLSLVTGTTKYEDFKDVDIVIEAVPEKMELKKKVFQELEPFLSEGAILASNTSALSISEMGAATKRPEKFIGMHFFYPASVMKLIEVIPGLATSTETIDDVTNFSESLRKIPIRVNECAGFLVNRLLMPYLNEAAYCLQEGAATREQIDEAVRAFGLPMGPFTLVDQLGIDICFDATKVLLDSFGNRMKPAEIWYKLHDAKYFGAKTGAGFYSYSPDKPDILQQLIGDVQKQTNKKGTKFSIERLLYPMINEAVYCLEENVAKAADIDLGMVAGIGFPQDKGGPLKYADEVGVDQVLTTLDSLFKEHGDRFWPAPRLKRMVGAKFIGKKSGRGFFEYTT